MDSILSELLREETYIITQASLEGEKETTWRNSYNYSSFSWREKGKRFCIIIQQREEQQHDFSMGKCMNARILDLLLLIARNWTSMFIARNIVILSQKAETNWRKMHHREQDWRLSKLLWRVKKWKEHQILHMSLKSQMKCSNLFKNYVSVAISSALSALCLSGKSNNAVPHLFLCTLLIQELLTTWLEPIRVYVLTKLIM